MFNFLAICFIKMWVFHYKHMGTMCKRSNYTQNAPQYEGDCEFYKTPKDIRLHCSHFCIYDVPSKNEVGLITRELGVT